jgi:hypothetical protein
MQRVGNCDNQAIVFPTFLAGQAVALRSLELSDHEALWSWFNDRDVVRYSLSGWMFPSARNEAQTWLEQTIQDKRTLTLGIVISITTRS